MSYFSIFSTKLVHISYVCLCTLSFCIMFCRDIFYRYMLWAVRLMWNPASLHPGVVYVGTSVWSNDGL